MSDSPRSPDTGQGAAPAPGKRKYRSHSQLSTSQKAQICTLWRQGEMTLDQLAKMFKKHRSTILAAVKEAGAVKGEDKKAVQERVQETVQQQIVDEATVIANRIRDTKEEHYKMATGIAKLTWKVVVDAQQAGKSMAVVAGDLKALKSAAETLRIAREERYAVLGIVEGERDDTDELPSLTVTELTAEDIKKMHAQNIMQAADEDAGIDELALGDEDILPVTGDEDLRDDVDDRVEVDD